MSLSLFAQSYQMAVLKYNGGGDYYANPTALPNLIKFCNSELGMNISKEVPYVEVGVLEGAAKQLNKRFFCFHEKQRPYVVLKRNYLLSGGFLHIDDNYGMDGFVRAELKKVFPEATLTELPSDHPIFSQRFKFPNGLPKIHEHDGKRPQAFGIVIDGRLVCIYTYETDLSDGWEDPQVHNDPPEKRRQALQMGANIISYAFSN